MRPVPGYAQHAADPACIKPSDTHPGGSVTGGPGRNAAVVILKDFGTSIEEVFEKVSEIDTSLWLDHDTTPQQPP